MSNSPKIVRSYEIAPPRPLVVQFHDPDCDCPSCEPYRPSAPPPMTDGEIARWAAGGLATGLGIASAISGPVVVLGMLRETLAWWLL